MNNKKIIAGILATAFIATGSVATFANSNTVSEGDLDIGAEIIKDLESEDINTAGDGAITEMFESGDGDSSGQAGNDTSYNEDDAYTNLPDNLKNIVDQIETDFEVNFGKLYDTYSGTEMGNKFESELEVLINTTIAELKDKLGNSPEALAFIAEIDDVEEY